MPTSNSIEASSALVMNTSVVFYVQVYGERADLVRCCKEIRRFYPTSRIIVCFDGDTGTKDTLQALFNDPHVEVEEGERLFGVESGGLVVERMLRLFLAGSGDVLIKVDADSCVKGRFRFLPSPNEVYIGGKLQSDGVFTSVQGGCIVLSRAACAAMVESQLLMLEALKPPTLAWAKSPTTLYRAQVLRLTSHDWIIGYAAKELNIDVQEHPEVMSYPGPLPLSKWADYYRAAVVHPRIRFSLGLGVFSPSNLLSLARGETRVLLQKSTQGNQFLLRLDDFTVWNLPPQVILWLVNNLPEGAPILELGSGKSSRELSRVFRVTSFEQDAGAERFPNVNYVISSPGEEYYPKAALEAALSEHEYAAIVVDGPRVSTLSGAFSRLHFLNFVRFVKGKPVIVVDDVHRLPELLLALCLLPKFPNFRLFFYKRKACLLLDKGPLSVKRSLKNLIRLIVNLPLLFAYSAWCLFSRHTGIRRSQR